MNHSSHKQGEKGFTLVEVLVAMLVFAIGLLGIASHLGQTIKANSRSDVHKTAMDVTFRIVEPLNQAIRQSNAAFQNTLLQLSSQQTLNHVISSGNATAEQFTLAITRAHDRNLPGDNPADLLTSNRPDLWIPPFTVSVQVQFAGDQGQPLNFITHYVLTP